MKKKINIVSYDSAWPEMFQAISEELKNILQENCITIHHVGSTSVPGLCAKPVIDIYCVVQNLKAAISVLEKSGYKYKGEYNLPLRLFFNKKKPYDLNLHVVKENNGEIQWQIVFRDYLRNNNEARDLYAQTKLNLIKEHPDGFNIINNFCPEYTLMKGEVIRKIAKMAGFNGYRFIIANNYYEIESYKTLMSLKEIDFNNKNLFHLCLYRGVKLVAAALVKFDIPNSRAIIKDIKSLNHNDKSVLIEKINEWTSFHCLMLI